MPGVAYSKSYTYDAVGNRLTATDNLASTTTTSTYDAANQLETSVDPSGTTDYTYDANGNLTTIVDPSSSVTSYTWDEENRRTVVELPSTEVVTSTYNGDGLRVTREDSSLTKKFIWDGQAYLAETDENDALQSVYTQRPAQFGGLASQRRLSGAVWSTDYFHYDALGSTVDITDSSEAVQESYVYDAWGNLLTASTLELAFLFVGDLGYYADWIEGSVLDYYVRARTYDPVIARWLSFDPLGLIPLTFVDGANLFEYVGSSPTRWFDPWGLAATDANFERIGVGAAITARTMTTAEAIHGKTFTARHCMGKRGCNIDFKFVKAYSGTYVSAGRRRRTVRGVYVKLAVSIQEPSEGCCCDSVKLVQAGRTITLNEGRIETIKPGGDYRIERAGWLNERAPSRGWLIDMTPQVRGRSNPIWGTHTANWDGNDGKFPVTGETSPAELWDAPGFYLRIRNRGWEFQTCAICDHGGKRKILGCVRWGFFVPAEGAVAFKPREPAVSCVAPQAVRDAIERWNGIRGNIDLDIDAWGSQASE